MQTIHVQDKTFLDHAVMIHPDMGDKDSDRHFVVGHDAVLNLTYLHTARASVQSNIAVDLVGVRASVRFCGAQILTLGQHGQIMMTVRHMAENTSSSQQMRMIADSGSTGKFHGKVIVEPNGKDSDARQVTRGLLLSSRADLVAQPELEINTDDVTCTHGASIGQIDADQLFYLTSRGVPMEDARRILLRAFLVGVFDNLSETRQQEFIAYIDVALDGHA